MLFSSLSFWLFFAAVFAVHWKIGSEKIRQRFLLLVSCAFYAAWDWRFLFLVLAVTASSYLGVRAMRAPDASEKRRKLAMAAVVAFQLAVLAVFKYAGFFVAEFRDFLALFGIKAPGVTLDILLPVGISFYTFHAISYVVDTYRRLLARETGFFDLAFYILFFPQLVAGPIVRSSRFLPQLDKVKKLERHVVISAVRLILLGLVYKVVLSDNIAPLVDAAYKNVGTQSDLQLILATMGFASQIYFDFAGYTNIAIGISRLLGYRIPRNFNFPYLAGSVAEFWHRWHISLSQWLRDYLYIPLGGSRKGEARTYLNLILTMLLGGLWHGAAWTFVIWGGIHGAALCVHRFASAQAERAGIRQAAWYRLSGYFLTLWTVLVAWAFFRAQTTADAFRVARAFLWPDIAWQDVAALPIASFTVFAPLIIDHLLMGTRGGRRWRLYAMPDWATGFAIGVAAALALAVLPLKTSPFIYFQF